jgi:hypothetical protein
MAEDRGKRSVWSRTASPVERAPSPFRFAMAAGDMCPGPGCYLILLRQHHAKDRRTRSYRVLAPKPDVN